MHHEHRTARRSLVPNRWRALVGALAAICLIAPTVASAETIYATYVGGATGRSVAFDQDGKERGAWAGTLRLELDSGEVPLVFCIQLNVTVRGGDRYRSDGPVRALSSGCAIHYILDNYPGSTATTGEEAAARQMAIWHFSDGIDLTTIADRQATLRDRAIEIASAAESGPCPEQRTSPPDLQVLPATAASVVGQRVVYTVAAGTQDAGRPIHAAVTGPASFDNGQQSLDLVLDASGGAVFGVTPSGEGESTVTVELHYQLGAGTVFSQIDDSRPAQRLVMAERHDLVAQANAQGQWRDADTPTVPAATATTVATTPAPTIAAPTVTPTMPVATLPATPGATETLPAATVMAVTVAPSGTAVTSSKRTPVASAVATSAAGTDRQVPSKLPSTGGGPVDLPWSGIGIAALLLALAWLARRRAVHE